jgi:DNA-binding GntR family transcriptional regulator
MKKFVGLLLLLCFVAMPLAASVNSDATRLASLLADTQDKATISAATWKAIANEATTYAGRMYLHRTPKISDDVKAARRHVLEMLDAAEKGDADGAKSHAGMALPYVYKVIDATMPKK